MCGRSDLRSHCPRFLRKAENLRELPSETSQQFESRKRDHIRLSLEDKNEAIGWAGFGTIQLTHEALPEHDFSDISLQTQSLGSKITTPFLVSSMTAGHHDSVDLNTLLAEACQDRGWRMGVGSQRKELTSSEARLEWAEVRKRAPKVELLANLGLSQIIDSPIDSIRSVVESLQGSALFVHLNSLQEVMQPEGTPYFKGGLNAIEQLVKKLDVPVIVKETGCGFSESTLKRVSGVGVAAIDVSGFGGTHWGRIEGGRSQNGSNHQKLSETFSHWGISTVQSLVNAQSIANSTEVWASGGIRNGLHAAKAIALGASVVGFAKPILQAALQGEKQLTAFMELVELELKTALFCTGCASVQELKSKKEVVTWLNR